MIRRTAILFLILFIIQQESFCQCPTADFTIPDTVCVNENIPFRNNSSNGSINTWNLCPDQLLNEDHVTRLSGNEAFRASYSLDLLQNPGKNTGMVLRNAGLLYRIEFNDDFDNIESIIPYTDERANFSLPRDMKILTSNGKWIGIATNSGPEDLTRINFGNSVEYNPVYDNLNGINPITHTNGLEILQNENRFLAFAGKDQIGEIYVLDFQEDLMNTPSISEFSIPGASGIQGISIVKNCDSWTGLATSMENHKLFKIIFSNGLSNPPEIEEILIGDTGFRFPAKVKIAVDNGHYYGFIQTDGGKLFRLNFGSSMENIPEISHIPAITENGYAFNLIEQDGKWNLFSVDYINATKGLLHLSFKQNCSLSTPLLNEFEPQDVSIQVPGIYQVSLTVSNNKGDFSNLTKALYVTGFEAPSIELSTNGNVCTESEISFGSASQGINSWLWDFGDGQTGSEQNPFHQYLKAGSYKVKLEISAENGCRNFVSDTIRIYDPPLADFMISESLLCTNDALTLVNQTKYSSPDSITSFNWNLDEEHTSHEKDTTFIFSSPGDKTITLIASIPGCFSEKIKVFHLFEGPNVRFTVQDACFRDTVKMKNESSGNPATYSWDFGDGTTSVLDEPVHLYPAPGTYTVTLEASALNGCTNHFDHVLKVHHIPQAIFNHELPCSGSPVTFIDASTVSEANITGWSWTYRSTTDPLLSGSDSLRSPVFEFPEDGNYEVMLAVKSNFGCMDTVFQELSVLPSPAAGFDFAAGCLGDTSYFADASTAPGNMSIRSWTWQIGQHAYHEPSPRHVFGESGIFDVYLTVQADNMCRNRTGSKITIHPLPVADFILENHCENEKMRLISKATSPGDPIKTYVWETEEAGRFTGASAEFEVSKAGNMLIRHVVQTVNGCLDSLSREFRIDEAPYADFDFDPPYGAAPLVATFSSLSGPGNYYHWDFEDSGETSDLVNPVHTFASRGDHRISLKVTNPSGCSDSTSAIIYVGDPVLDVAIVSVESAVLNGTIYFYLVLKNQGSLPVENMDIAIGIEGRITVKEIFDGLLKPDEQVRYPLDFKLYDQSGQRPGFICFEIDPKIPGHDDDAVGNNKACISFDPGLYVHDPYPNPSNGPIRLDLILPEQKSLFLQLIGNDGKIIWTRNYPAVSAGLNSFMLETELIREGNYLLRIRYDDQTIVKKIAVVR